MATTERARPTFRVLDAMDAPHGGRIVRLRLQSGEPPSIRRLKGARLRATSVDGTTMCAACHGPARASHPEVNPHHFVRGTAIVAYACAALLTLLVCASRVYLGVHFPSDVLGGVVGGVAWLTICQTGAGVARRRAATRATPTA